MRQKQLVQTKLCTFNKIFKYSQSWAELILSTFLVKNKYLFKRAVKNVVKQCQFYDVSKA